MKTLTKYLLPRYIWFLLWYKQWFRNPEGIKGFAHQVMNWLMQSTLGLAQKLKRENKSLSEGIKSKTALCLLTENNKLLTATQEKQNAITRKYINNTISIIIIINIIYWLTILI